MVPAGEKREFDFVHVAAKLQRFFGQSGRSCVCLVLVAILNGFLVKSFTALLLVAVAVQFHCCHPASRSWGCKLGPAAVMKNDE